MAAYTTHDAMRELSQLLAKAPAGAVREWEATTDAGAAFLPHGRLSRCGWGHVGKAGRTV